MQFIGQTEPLSGPLAAQLVRSLVVLKVLASEFGDMHQPVDIQLIERYEYSEGRDSGDSPGELFTHPLAHVLTLEPGLDIA